MTDLFNQTQLNQQLTLRLARPWFSQQDNAANAPQKLKLGQLFDTASTFGTFTQDAYDARQIESVLKTSF